MMSALEKRASEFANAAHYRTGDRLPSRGHFILHPGAVANLVRTVPHTDEMLCAAWLHDTVRCTTVTPEQIAAAFGAQVAELVAMVTRVPRRCDGGRAMRHRLDVLHAAQANPSAQTIKLAELIDTAITVSVWYPAHMAPVFLAEKAELLHALPHAAPLLRVTAEQTLLTCFRRHGMDSASLHRLPQEEVA